MYLLIPIASILKISKKQITFNIIRATIQSNNPPFKNIVCMATKCLSRTKDFLNNTVSVSTPNLQIQNLKSIKSRITTEAQ